MRRRARKPVALVPLVVRTEPQAGAKKTAGFRNQTRSDSRLDLLFVKIQPTFKSLSATTLSTVIMPLRAGISTSIFPVKTK
jgi:hypothetical protein